MAFLADALMNGFPAKHCGEALRWSRALSSTLCGLELGLDVIMRVSVCCCRCLADRRQPGCGCLGLLTDALLNVHRNRRLIRDGGGAPWPSSSYLCGRGLHGGGWRVATWVPAVVSVLQAALMIYQLSIGRPQTPFV